MNDIQRTGDEPAWAMGVNGPQATVPVPGWGTVKLVWGDGTCAAHAYDDEDRPELGIVRGAGQHTWYVHGSFSVRDWAVSDSFTVRRENFGMMGRSSRIALLDCIRKAAREFTEAHPEVSTEGERLHLQQRIDAAQAAFRLAELNLQAAQLGMALFNQNHPEAKKS